MHYPSVQFRCWLCRVCPDATMTPWSPVTAVLNASCHTCLAPTSGTRAMVGLSVSSASLDFVSAAEYRMSSCVRLIVKPHFYSTLNAVCISILLCCFKDFLRRSAPTILFCCFLSTFEAICTDYLIMPLRSTFEAICTAC